MQSSNLTASVNENSGGSWLDDVISLTLFRGVQTPQGRAASMTYRALVERWQRPGVCVLKQLVPGWSPARFEGDKRAKVGVLSVGALVLDYEPAQCALPRGAPAFEGACPVVAVVAGDACEAWAHLEEDCHTAANLRFCDRDSYASGTRVEDACDTFRALGWGFVLHTSYSHLDPRKGAAPRFRVVLPLSRPVSADEYPALWSAVAALVGEAGHQIDASVKDASRFWFEPALREEGARGGYALQVDDGARLDVAALLAPRPAPPASAPSPEALGVWFEGMGEAPTPSPRVAPPGPPPVRPAAGGGAGAGAPRRATGEAPPEGTPARARYAAAALDRAEAAIRAAQPGQRSDALNKEAYGLGGLIGPELSEGDVVARLLAATAGWPDPRKTESTLRRAVKAGLNNPRRGSSNGGTGERPGGAGPASLGSWSMPARAAAGAPPEPPADDADWGDGTGPTMDDMLDAYGDGSGAPEPPEGSGRFDDDGVEIPASAGGGASPPAGGGYPADGDDGKPRDTRPVIQITVNRHIALDSALACLALCPDLYQRNGKLVLAIADRLSGPQGGGRRALPQIRPVSKPRLAEILSRTVRFEQWKTDKDGEQEAIPCAPPSWLVDQILERGEWDEQIRPLCAVASSPVLRSDGTVLETPGYDPKTALLYCPQRDFLPVKESPTLEDAKAARDTLFALVKDFPFETRAHRSAWLAALLTPLARHAFEGAAPLMLIEANTRASGKSKLAYIIGIIVTGNTPENLSYTPDDAEMDKRILSVARAGDQITYFDNVDVPLGNGPLNNALTTTSYRGRALGTNDMEAHELRTTFMASGNNVRFAADTARRCLVIRLFSPEQNPEKREVSDKKILTTTGTNRAEYLRDALTILRAYFVAGRPEKPGLPGWGSAEGWSELIRQCIVWLDLPDPGETRDATNAHGDTEGNMLELLLDGWTWLQNERAKPNGLTVLEVLGDLDAREKDEDTQGLREALCTLCNTPPGKLPSPASLGNKLSHLRGRVFDGKCLERGPKTRNGYGWRVIDAPIPEEWKKRAEAAEQPQGGESEASKP